ncbi:MAG: DUF1465 family protein [Alphaproteobacteria bacterium]|nr:DUF1465 family protein [Alphaproteobacteria bacterium]
MTHDASPLPPDDALTLRVKGFATSQQFTRMFQDGMAMVEETAAYLDGPGREESKTLPRRAALTYAGESMRLTTRLMQVASWLLVQRAVREGDMSVAEAAKEKYRLGAREICKGRKAEAEEMLPARLVDLLRRSEHLYERVDRLDGAVYRGESDTSGNGALAHLGRLQAEFGASE